LAGYNLKNLFSQKIKRGSRGYVVDNKNNEENKSGRMPRIPRVLKHAGFNAIELSLVLAVIAIALVATIRIMAGNSDKQSSNQMVNDISTLVSNIKNAYSSSTTGYSTLTTEAAVDGKMVPQDLKMPGGGTIQNQFQGGTVTVAAGAAGDNFTITYTNVPTAICNSAINTLGGSSFLMVDINGTAVYDASSSVALDGTNVSAACKSGGEKSTVIFTAS
jgi:prepilin-type N-terminal cleavage/methylation domain-containing protein